MALSVQGEEDRRVPQEILNYEVMARLAER